MNLQEEFADIERRFFHFDAKLDAMLNDLTESDDATLERLQTNFETNLNSCRRQLLSKMINDRNQRLKALDCKNLSKFICPSFDLEQYLPKLIANKDIENSNFMKFKYLAPDLEPISTYQKCSNGVKTVSKHNYKISRLYLSQCLLMNLVETSKNAKSVQVNIENMETGEDLYSSRLRLKYDQSYQAISYGLFVVILIYNDFQSQLHLLYYDRDINELILLKQATLCYRVTLHSLNRNELICLQTNRHASHRYVVFDYEFEQTAQFGQKNDPNGEFFVKDSSLIGVSLSRIYLYFYDIRTQKHRIKILNRLTGLVERLIDLDKGSESYRKTKFNCIKLDPSYRIMVRCGGDNDNDDTVRYYDSNGDYLFDICHNYCFGKFKQFEHISDEFICFSQSKVPGLVAFL